ncbi:hypothetical protein PGT21_007692 [Puccinia graminis f. sp. tritici]|uniref:Uncharacterized protein n=1 Tax=Puccinia graminis f. sp. tritici TaxID=56615 RepID=A0A5B0PRB5_PUCGR|nr:hypothetical protein PGT21_007692 [Puccinia graminis f. sp. tritici]
MTTRSANQELLPESDPNLIIRAGNAEKRKAKLLAESEARVKTNIANAETRKSLNSPTTSESLHPPKTNICSPLW